MLMFIRASRLFAGLQFLLLALYTGFAFAEPDPTKVLIGRWEGGIQGFIKGKNERTLVIISVKPNNEGGWVAQGNWNVTGEGGGIRQGIDVSLQNDLIVLQFRTRGNDPVRLVLKGDNRLEGTLDLARAIGTGIKHIPAGLSLEKVKAKRGDAD